VIVTGGDDGTVRLWDVASGVELRQLPAHTGRAFSAAFSPDGAMIVTAGCDQWDDSSLYCVHGTARLWDATSGAQIRRIEVQEGWVGSAVFSPDGETIVTGGEDGIVCLWPSIEHLLAQAESLIQRDPPIFTPEERRRYGLDE
jgi:WD40 repeat protein